MGNSCWGLGIHLIFISISLVSILTHTCLGAENLTMTCSIQERLALLKFKNSIKDDDGILSSWVGNDCCQWEGVHCDGATGSVVSLHLRQKVTEPSYGDTVGVELFGEDYYFSGNEFDVREKHQLVGYTVNSCLAKLRHLRYLDLSGNYFGGSQIPEFIGSFKKLSYLNLSNAGFMGNIPHHIGNLSNLKVLDLSTTEPVMVDDMAWFSGLSSLEHLNLTGVNLRRVQNIDRLLYMIPSLLKLSLSECSLSNANFGTHPNSSTKLANIRHLDLSWNNIESQLPVFLQNMTSLAFLDLSGSNLSLIWNSANMLSVFPSLSELHLSSCGLKTINLNFSEHSNIQHLCLSNNDFRGRFPHFLANMSSLLSLDLSNNDLNSPIPVMRSFLKLDLSSNGIRKMEYVGIWRQCHLKELIMSDNYFHEELVGSSTNVSECSQYALERLNLGANYLNGLISKSLGRLANLRELDLSDNKLTGPIPEDLGKLRSLQVLDLHLNELTGPVPEALGKLRHLISLDLSRNLLKGPIPTFQGKLSKLHLDRNQLNGSIPESLGTLSGLTVLRLQSNQLEGPIPVSLGRLASLQVFSVSSNFLNGTIPVSFGQLSRLGYFDVFNNSLVGMVSEDHFANLSMLEYLNLAYNNKLTFNVSREWIPPFQLRSAQLGSCNISDEFPRWFRTQRKLEILALSNASISGPLPTWLHQMPINVLDLSHNRLTGTLKNLPCVNRFRGRILMQNNLFRGPIPRLLCRKTNLDILDLSRNRLTGKIPMCLGNLDNLYMMVLSSNRLSGVIPSSLGEISSLCWLHLNDNNLSGELPNEFGSFRSMYVLDLGENKFSGNLPDRIGENLMVLRLHKNNLTGRIPQSLCKLQSLQILDLAHNSLTGSIPHCFGEFSAMMTEFPSRYSNPHLPYDQDGKVMQVINGVALEYTKTVRLVSNMDLSSNKLVGEIPQELTALNGLLGLNLSHNHLTGRIPKDTGNMTSLFSLYFSANQLTGMIPLSIAALTFLSYLNLSYNSLSGRIPTGNQLQTLTDPSLYAGNRDLCGAPLPKNCSNHEDPTSNDRYGDANKPKKVWLYVDIMSGFATGFWGIIGVLMFKKQWRHKLFKFTEATIDNIHVAIAVRISKMKRGRIGA